MIDHDLPLTVRAIDARRARGLRRTLRRALRTIFGLLVAALVATGPHPATSSTPASEAGMEGRLHSLLGEMDSNYSKLNDYTAIFRKRERIGKSDIYDEKMFLKFQKPFKVYLKWIDEPREALYVVGEYNNQVQVHYKGLFGMTTSSFSPGNALLMHNNRHPITNIGVGFIFGIMKFDIAVAERFNELEIVKICEDKFDGRPSILVDVRFTPHDGRKYYAPHIIGQIDQEFMVPVSISCYDANGEFQEQYSYVDVKINPGLKGIDFSMENKEYHFH